MDSYNWGLRLYLKHLAIRPGFKTIIPVPATSIESSTKIFMQSLSQGCQKVLK